MKKTALIFFILLLPFIAAAAGGAAQAILLKNGGRFMTPLSWEEGPFLKFYIPGGTMGIEKNVVWKIETVPDDTNGVYLKAAEAAPAPAKATPAEAAKGQAAAGKEKDKTSIQEHKKKKDELAVELDGLLDQVKAANRTKDAAAKEKAKEDIRKVSKEIYRITDVVTEQNDGKLPEGWWIISPPPQQ